jgi:alcohol dehydrogenase, propanol-preferring
MRAAVLRSLRQPLVVEDLPTPEPGPEQVLVRIETSGVCHSDLHAARGDWPVKPKLPLIPGHEGVGIVERAGAAVPATSDVRVGDRVAVPWLGSACGRCRHCASGWETLCRRQVNHGYLIDGTHAEYAVAHGRFVGRVPDGVDPLDAAPLTCAGVTAYRALRVASTGPGDLVAVFGIGGLGHLAVQYAKILGAAVVAIDVVEDKLRMAEELGADHVVNAVGDDPDALIKKLGGATVALGLSTSARALATAHASLARGGRLVLVSLPADGVLQLPIFPTVLRGLTVIGSASGTRADLEDVFALHAAGRTRVVRGSRRLDQVNEAFADLEAGRVPARLVLDLR